MKSIIFIALVAILTTSCNPLKHYQKVATDTNVTPKKKAVIAPWVSVNFPITETVIKGKDSIIIDTSYNQEKIDSLENAIDLLVSGKDSINIDSLKKVIIANCKPVTVTKVIHRVDTVVKKDNAALFAVQEQLNTLSATNKVIEAENNKLKEEAKSFAKQQRQNVTNLVLACIALVVLAALYIKKVFT